MLKVDKDVAAGDVVPFEQWVGYWRRYIAVRKVVNRLKGKRARKANLSTRGPLFNEWGAYYADFHLVTKPVRAHGVRTGSVISIAATRNVCKTYIQYILMTETTLAYSLGRHMCAHLMLQSHAQSTCARSLPADRPHPPTMRLRMR